MKGRNENRHLDREGKRSTLRDVSIGSRKLTRVGIQTISKEGGDDGDLIIFSGGRRGRGRRNSIQRSTRNGLSAGNKNVEREERRKRLVKDTPKLSKKGGEQGKECAVTAKRKGFWKKQTNTSINARERTSPGTGQGQPNLSEGEKNWNGSLEGKKRKGH